MKSCNRLLPLVVFVLSAMVLQGCYPEPNSKKSEIKNDNIGLVAYKEIVDLGMLITEDLPERIIGKAAMENMGWEKNNEFDVRYWEFPTEDSGTIKGSDTYFTLFNHAGSHVDAPNHGGYEGGIDSYPLEAFIGPVKVFDLTEYSGTNPAPKDIFDGTVSAGDIVLTYVNFVPAQPENSGSGFNVHLTEEASDYLAELPVRAFGTDAASAGTSHPAFLTRNIPIYEQLINVDKLLGKNNMMFFGVPINIKDADGSFVRPIVMIFD